MQIVFLGEIAITPFADRSAPAPQKVSFLCRSRSYGPRGGWGERPPDGSRVLPPAPYEPSRGSTSRPRLPVVHSRGHLQAAPDAPGVRSVFEAAAKAKAGPRGRSLLAVSPCALRLLPKRRGHGMLVPCQATFTPFGALMHAIFARCSIGKSSTYRPIRLRFASIAANESHAPQHPNQGQSHLTGH